MYKKKKEKNSSVFTVSLMDGTLFLDSLGCLMAWLSSSMVFRAAEETQTKHERNVDQQ